MAIVDLSQPIRTGMPVFPGDPAVQVAPVATVGADGYAVSGIALGSHSGTHVDAPAHLVEGGLSVERIPFEWLSGDARVLHPSGRPLHAGLRIGLDRLPALTSGDPAPLPMRALIATDWDERFEADDALDHPFLDLTVAEELWRRGVRLLGIDTWSPDPSGGSALPVHEFWLGSGGVIVEHLRGLAALPECIDLTVLPLPLAGADGAPARVIARIAADAG